MTSETGSQDERLRRLAVLGELVKLTRLDDAMRQVHRHELLTGLDELEAGIRALIADPGPLVRDGQPVTDADGKAIPDPRVRGEAKKALHRLGRERTRCFGPGE